MSIKELQTELEFFEKERKSLLERAPGKFALIKETELAGTFDSHENAYKAGIRLFGSEPFFIQQILPEDPTSDIPALFLGLMNAGL